MTYCLAIKLNEGLIFASDSRTNAGVDYISTYSKMHILKPDEDRMLVLLAAGNLGTTQAVVNQMRRELAEAKTSTPLHKANHLFDIASYIGEQSLKIQKRYRKQKEADQGFEANFILGGQLGMSEMDLFHIYPEGNYINASTSQPYLQIGESKYGKPILDRILSMETSLEDAARCALVSLDSTVRSNISVGMPFELAIYEKDQHQLSQHLTLEQESEYYHRLRDAWGEGLRQIFNALPRFDWE